jgi:WhiB family redox-sensing transcriptional regulator
MGPRRKPAETLASHRRDWRALGACRDEDPELFFPVTSKGPAARQLVAAKAICAGCGVSRECLRFALENRQDHGVWGGTSEEERKLMRSAGVHARRRLGHVTTAAASLRQPASPRVVSGRRGKPRRPSRPAGEAGGGRAVAVSHPGPGGGRRARRGRPYLVAGAPLAG